ncbi:MAG: carbonic anhydrase [Ignavibacteriales bacterium]|nr:carbonic anhydrase [Ignavibacteriales bacterium]
MNRLIRVSSVDHIPREFRDSPIARLLEYHNLNRPFDSYTSAELLIGMCMDSRKSLRIPDNFAFILRAGGGNLRYSEFKVSYAIGIGGAKAIALIGHTNCGMVNLASRKDQFISGLVTHGGWSTSEAEEHFLHFSSMFEIGNEIDFVLSEARRLRVRYPKILVAPLIYRVEDNLLYSLEE